MPPHTVAFVFDSGEPPFGRGLPPSRPFAGGMADGPFAFKGFCPPAASAPAALASLPPVPARRRPLRGEILTARRVCAARAPGGPVSAYWRASDRVRPARRRFVQDAPLPRDPTIWESLRGVEALGAQAGRDEEREAQVRADAELARAIHMSQLEAPTPAPALAPPVPAALRPAEVAARWRERAIARGAELRQRDGRTAGQARRLATDVQRWGERDGRGA